MVLTQLKVLLTDRWDSLFSSIITYDPQQVI